MKPCDVKPRVYLGQGETLLVTEIEGALGRGSPFDDFQLGRVTLILVLNGPKGKRLGRCDT